MSNNDLGGFRTPTKLIEDLVNCMSCWDKHEEYYLTTVVPMLVKNPKSGGTKEQPILRELRTQLTQSEWEALPQLMAEYRKGNLREFECERLKRGSKIKRQQKAEQNRRKSEVEADRDRIHHERLRKENEARRQEFLTQIDKKLQRDFLGVESFFQSQMSCVVSDDEFKTKKIAFVREWFKDRNERLGKTGSPIPDDEQLEAIATVNGHVQVVARAGSGKTATLVNRALFLMEHCQVAPSSLLLLAFNRKAAREVRHRLLVLMHCDAERQIKLEVDKRLAECRKKKHPINHVKIEVDSADKVANRLRVDLPHIMTFHALAYALVHPEESLLYDDAEGNSLGLSRVMQSVIDEHIRIPEYKRKIRELMIEHFKEDWDRIITGGYDLSKNELLNFKRSMPRESLGGEYVKSYGEKLIANFLFEHGISYKYERTYKVGNINYRPDFTIFKTPKSGIIIEYFGLQGDPDYDDISEKKRSYWENQTDWELIEFSPIDIKWGHKDFKARLKKCLEQQGVACNQLSEEEIWQKVRVRAIDRFTKTVGSFVGRCRSLSLTPDALYKLIDAHKPLSSVEAMFLQLVQILYSAYLDRLSFTGEEDFNGLMQRAAKMISKGETRFNRKTGSGDLANLKFIFIDEFQDFSDLFYRLLSSIRKVNPSVQLFCVGDDWQAINGFAGSDLQFFEQFEDVIKNSIRLYISTNYRSAKSIVSVGNSLMSELGKPAVAAKQEFGTVIIADVSTFIPTLIEERRNPGDIITPMVSRIASKSLETCSNIVLLSRKNDIQWPVNNRNQVQRAGNNLEVLLESVRSLFPKDMSERITISTTHRYKGLEKPTVVVLDAIDRCYPLIHPDWVFSRVLGQSLEKTIQEERRLFYVALTRAIEKLVIITDIHSQSPFLNELQSVMPLENINWKNYPATPEKTCRLIIKVGNQEDCKDGGTYRIREQLKSCGYQWKSTGWKGWVKTCLAEGFQLENIRDEVWTEEADGIEVRICDESERILEVFEINRGKWVPIVDDLHLIDRTSDDNVDDDMEVPR